MFGTFGVENYVFWLDISVDYLLRVHVFQREKNAGCKKSSLLLVKSMFSADMVAQVSSWHKIHDEVQSVSILESLPHIDNEFMFKFFEKVSFVAD